MEIKVVLQESWNEYTEQFVPLVRVCAPFIIAYMLLAYALQGLAGQGGALVIVLSYLTSLILQALIILFGLRYLFELRGVRLDIDAGTVINLVLATILVGVATAIGLMLLILPGILIMAVCFAMPIFVLRHGEGPLQAIASSVRTLKVALWPISAMLLGVWIVLVLVNYFAGVLVTAAGVPGPLALAVINGVSMVLALFLLPLMLSVYGKLHEQPA